MTTSPDNSAPRDRSSGASAADAPTVIPEWAPLDLFPSSAMVLAAFAGVTSMAAADILNPAADLVECQRQYRLALKVLAETTTGTEALRQAAADLVAAQEDREIIVGVIDDAVAAKVLQLRKRQASEDAIAGAAVVHTETVGDVVARMAEFWDEVDAGSSGDGIEPAANWLRVVAEAYDLLIADIAAGQRVPPGL